MLFSLCCNSFLTNAENYIIIDIDVGEPILIGKALATIGSEFSGEDSVYWPDIEICIEAVKKNDLKSQGSGKAKNLEREFFSSPKQSKGVIKQYKMNLGARGNSVTPDLDNIFVIHKVQDIKINVKTNAIPNTFPEIIFKDRKEVLPIKRVQENDGGYYLIPAKSLLQVASSSSFVISIRERSVVNERLIYNVYQDLIVVHFP